METVKFSPEGKATRGEASPETQQKIEQVEAAEAALVQSADELLAELGSGDEIIVVPVEFTVAGKARREFIKRLSYEELSKTDAKRYRKKPNGQIDYDSSFAATTGLGYQIHFCAMMDTNAGKVGPDDKPLPPEWVPKFSLEKITGKGGLMQSRKPQAKEYIYALLNEIWTVNEEMSPFTQAQALGGAGQG